MQALLDGDDITPSLRNSIDLIYIDPPFEARQIIEAIEIIQMS